MGFACNYPESVLSPKCPIMVIVIEETVWMDFAKVMVIGLVSNLEFMPLANLRKLSFKNVEILAYVWIACLKKLKGKG